MPKPHPFSAVRGYRRVQPGQRCRGYQRWPTGHAVSITAAEICVTTSCRRDSTIPPNNTKRGLRTTTKTTADDGRQRWHDGRQRRRRRQPNDNRPATDGRPTDDGRRLTNKGSTAHDTRTRGENGRVGGAPTPRPPGACPVLCRRVTLTRCPWAHQHDDGRRRTPSVRQVRR